MDPESRTRYSLFVVDELIAASRMISVLCTEELARWLQSISNT
jgi:hypothetical protein